MKWIASVARPRPSPPSERTLGPGTWHREGLGEATLGTGSRKKHGPGFEGNAVKVAGWDRLGRGRRLQAQKLAGRERRFKGWSAEALKEARANSHSASTLKPAPPRRG